jgi:hypothetical protein
MQACPVLNLFLPPCLVPGSPLTLICTLSVVVEAIIAVSIMKYFPESFSGACSLAEQKSVEGATSVGCEK